MSQIETTSLHGTGPGMRVFGVLGIMFVASALAENSVVLESFETSIGIAAKGTWAGSSARLPDGVILTQYSKVDDADPFVTEGSKALRVDLTLDDGWSQDFSLTLSPEASRTLQNAVASSDVARYVFRYDVVLVFPAGGGISGVNHEILFGDLHDELIDLKPGKYTMSVALDLLTGLPEVGEVTIRLANNFMSSEDPFVGPLTLYIDNLRLVDTYVPDAVPLVYMLQSFENDEHPTGDVAQVVRPGVPTRTVLSRYQAADESDGRVSDGTHALRVDFLGVGGWGRDFRVPLNGTKLGEVLRLDHPLEDRPTREQLHRYTLRFDVVFPDLAPDWGSDWMLLTLETPAEWYRVTKGRVAGAGGRRETFSMTLDQVSWGEAGQGAPAIIVSHSGGWGASGTTLFYDSFRLIDTGSVSLPSDPPVITSVHYDVATGRLRLAWRGTPGRTYDVEHALEIGGVVTVAFADVPCPLGQASVAGEVSGSSAGFLRIRQRN